VSVLRSKDGKELILDCRCGCKNGIHFRIEENKDDYIFDEEYMYMTYMNGNFYRDQNNRFFRTLKNKLSKICAIIFNKDYYYAEAVFSKDDFEEFKEYINSFAVHKENNSTDVVENQ